MEQIVEPRKVVAMQKALETVHIDPAILGYIVQVVQRTRADPRIEAGASPRLVKACSRLQERQRRLMEGTTSFQTMSKELLLTWSATESY